MGSVGLDLIVRAAATLLFTRPNGGPGGWSFEWQSGDFAPPVIVRGVGDIEIDFMRGFAVSEFECAIICTPREPQVASGLTTIGVTHTNETRKRFNIVQEQGGGAASVRADVSFDLYVVSRGGR